MLQNKSSTELGHEPSMIARSAIVIDTIVKSFEDNFTPEPLLWGSEVPR